MKPIFLDYQLLTSKIPKDLYKPVTDFYLKIFPISFEDQDLKVSEFQIKQGSYLRIKGEENLKEIQNHVHLSISVADIKETHQFFSESCDKITPVNTWENMETYFEITDPCGLVIRFCEFEHGPIEWKESLEKIKKSKNVSN